MKQLGLLLSLTATLTFAVPAGSLRAMQATGKPVATSKPVSASLTNADVVKMANAGLDDALIITAIRAAKKMTFTLTPDALIALRTDGVSNAVIAVMMDPTAPLVSAPSAAAAVAATATTTDPDDPMAPHDSGIYVDIGTEKPRLVVLGSAVFSQTKSGGMFKSAMTMGIKKMNWKAVVKVPQATRRVTTAKPPAFYFYFDQKTSGFGTATASATNTSEFVLARMAAQKDSRELIVGQLGAFGNSMGPRSQDTVEFKTDTLAPGIYRVSPAAPLKPGEYCFFPTAGSAFMGLGGGKLFDFGVDKN